ncbi:uncharacterized protein TRIADDRAFT_55771 [Trichoplax adhaerens]|uniref:DNA replication complex GINS protein PSF2 n=1 Tax=Trichoplax adhaerens TaxID=10228 RepID=B3RVT8_TRIAD|nr:hypothetical protein TRIADDRAFT_55771 [Trichoplax adhaerens]EDV25557.1 hypothetical protein TRIADDRAFT_55771 [Trichoplax adhaerens]|eukprot:XP_002111590.1 hypothetical protein TRIADDRAFT_55771 [Trichoplax adhaerens]
MEACEIEFLAEDSIVTVLPNFSENKIYLISGDVGPFNPSMPTDLPLWLAIDLKQRQKCRIQPPKWMNVETLQELKQAENDSALFCPMPDPHYIEITQLLMNCAAEDIPHADEIKTLIKDIADLRMAKLKKSMDGMIKEKATNARLDNLSMMEINLIRPLLTQALDQSYRLQCLQDEQLQLAGTE